MTTLRQISRPGELDRDVEGRAGRERHEHDARRVVVIG